MASDAAGAEVIVVDSASSENCSDMLKREFPTVQYVRSDENIGSSGGWNLGATHASRKLIVLMNDDVRVAPRWLCELVRPLQDPDVGITSGLVILEGTRTINSMGGACDLHGFSYAIGCGESIETFRTSSQPKPFFAVGTVFATRTDVLHRVGGFDQKMFMYSDDLDFSWRVRLAGYNLSFVEDSVVYHEWHGSGMHLNRIVFFGERNRLRMILKTYSWPALVWLSPSFVLIRFARLAWLMARHRQLARSVVSAWGHAIRELPDTIAERRVVQRTRRVHDRDVLKALSFASLEMAQFLGLAKHPLLSNFGIRRA
jgi:hypothetical protein